MATTNKRPRPALTALPQPQPQQPPRDFGPTPAQFAPVKPDDLVVIGKHKRTYRTVRSEDRPEIMRRLLSMDALQRKVQQAQADLALQQTMLAFAQEAMEAWVLRHYNMDTSNPNERWSFHDEGPDGPFFHLEGTELPKHVQKWLADRAAAQQAPAPAPAPEPAPPALEDADTAAPAS